MRKNKKILSLLLLACMAFALTIPALAAVPTGTVTVDNAVPGEKFDFFRILQFNETTSNYEVVPAYRSTLQTFTGKTTDAEILVALSAIESGDLNIAGSNNDAKELAYALYAVAKNQSNSGTVTVAAGANTATITLPYGYYLVIPHPARRERRHTRGYCRGFAGCSGRRQSHHPQQDGGSHH